jgi:hypothetical protein
MHQQFNIQQLYALPTLYLFVLYLSENKQRLLPHINWSVFITEMKSVYSAVRTGSLNKAVCVSSLKGQYQILQLQWLKILPIYEQIHVCVSHYNQPCYKVTGTYVCHTLGLPVMTSASISKVYECQVMTE